MPRQIGNTSSMLLSSTRLRIQRRIFLTSKRSHQQRRFTIACSSWRKPDGSLATPIALALLERLVHRKEAVTHSFVARDCHGKAGGAQLLAVTLALVA